MKKYSEELKKEAVRLALEGGMSHSRVSRDPGMNVNSLAGWIRRAKVDSGEQVTETLERENRRYKLQKLPGVRSPSQPRT